MSQIAPNPNPSGSTISVAGTPAENFESFENNGGITIDGTLNNFAILNSNTGGSIRIETGSTLNNYGTLNSIGEFEFVVRGWDAGTVNNYNTFSNANTDTNYVGFLNNYNAFTNAGSLTIFVLQNTGTVTNSAGATLGVDGLSNSGTLNNSGTIDTAPQSDVTNSGTLNNSGALYFGDMGTLHNSGILNNSGNLDSNKLLNNSGTLNNSGNSHYVLPITGTGTYIQTAGQTVYKESISQASILIKGGSLSGPGMRASGAGTITGNVTISSGASFNPGNSQGPMAINGDFTSGGTLVFEMAGLGSGLYDMLNINGNANFTGGNIQFDFINGFIAAAGNHWDFFHANTITGWNTLHVSVNGLGAGLKWKITSLSNGKKRLSII